MKNLGRNERYLSNRLGQKSHYVRTSDPCYSYNLNLALSVNTSIYTQGGMHLGLLHPM